MFSRFTMSDLRMGSSAPGPGRMNCSVAFSLEGMPTIVVPFFIVNAKAW